MEGHVIGKSSARSRRKLDAGNELERSMRHLAHFY